MPQIIDPGAFAHTREGVNRAESLAALTMETMVSTTDVACLDTTITSIFMLAEIFAGLAFYAGIDPVSAMAEAEPMTAARLAALRAEDAGCTCQDDGDVHEPAEAPLQ